MNIKDNKITLYGIAKKIICDISEANCIDNLTEDVAAKLQLTHGDVYVIPKEELKKILARYTNEWEDDLPF